MASCMTMPIRTTIYLPEELKEAVEREAARRGISEAQLIREAVAKEVGLPRPNAGFLDAEPIAERVAELLEGFGER